MNKDKEIVQKLKNELYENDSHIEKLNIELKSEKEKSEKLKVDLNFVLQKNNSLNENISQVENLFLSETKKYESEVIGLKQLLDNNCNALTELENKFLKITIENENYKKKIKDINIDLINNLREVDIKKSIINDLESINAKLNKNIKDLTDKINDYKCSGCNNNNIEDNLLFVKQKDELNNVKKSNLYLTEQIEIIRRRNKYLDDEISRMNHEVFDYQTIINTMKNSKYNNSVKKKNKCCCVIN